MLHIRKIAGKRISQRGWLRLFAVVAIAAIFIAGCGSDDDAEPETPTTTAAQPSPPTTATTAPPPTTSPPTTSPPTTTTTAPPPAPPEYGIAAGANHTCTLNEGRVLCWGNNLHGQLGNGESGPTVHSSVPVEAEGITDAVALGAGWEHTCAVHATGEVSCWGDDTSGELGNGETADSVPEPVKVIGLDDAVDVTAGHWHTCALRSTGEVSCWGRNHDGQLGNGDMGVDSAVPVSVRGISDAVSVSANGEHSCAVHATGEVSCWGDNWEGEFGNGESGPGIQSAVPVKASGVADAVAVASGYNHTCALREGGKVSCWGNNEFGQVGNGVDFVSEALDGSLIVDPVEVVSLDDAIAVSAGGAYSCALRETGEISCWGTNTYGQLGNIQATFSNPTPLPVSGIDDAVVIAAGAGHICAVRQGGSISCLGSNIYGELGNGQSVQFSSEQVKVAGIDDAVDVSSAIYHSCVLHSTSEVSCWGRFWKGQAGDAATGDTPPVPIKVDGITDAIDIAAGNLISCAARENEEEVLCWGRLINSEITENEDGQISPVPIVSPLQASMGVESVIEIAAGGTHVCALETDGTITCTGVNMFGQIGSGEFSQSFDFEFSNVPDIDDATDISLGYDHTCALHESGEISCWGRNNYGQLGTGEENVGIHSALPQRVVGIADAIAVEAGALTTSCALHETGEVSCWGQSDRGELGTNADPANDHSAVPVKIAGITDAIAVTAGLYHVCALHESGEVSCWGAGFFGQLGTDEIVDDGYSAAPVKASGISDAVALSAGFNHNCALHQTGEVTCWGSNINGQLGNGDPLASTTSPTPVTVASPTSVSDVSYDIAAGVSHSCTLKEGKVLCWGNNLHGQLGNGESGAAANSSVPVEAEGITDAVAVGAGWEHTCAVHATGEVSCWGDDTSGELGNGETANSEPLPVKVIGLDDATDVTAGHWHTCALRSTGEVSCWGRNHDGQLGNDDMGVDSYVPVPVTGISDAVSVSVNGEHSCAVHATGEVSCWGDNWEGELGTGESGPNIQSAVPVKVSGVSDAVAVASGFDHTCALREGGKVSCWGSNEFGQIGNGIDFITEVQDGSNIVDPSEVVSLDNAIAITAGGAASCALLETGDISCWGSNSNGRLGNTIALFGRPTPLTISGISDAVGVAAGGRHTCAVLEGGSVSCLGSNFYGELGNGQSGQFTSEQVKVAGIEDAAALSSSLHHSCVLHSNSEVSCWGSLWKGASGDAATGESPPVPIKIDGINDAAYIAAGNLLSCAVRENDEILCWGRYIDGEFTENEDGQISPAPTVSEISEMQASLGVESVTKIAAEGIHVCVLETDGTITCAGSNAFGQLGSGQFSETLNFAFSNVPDIDDATDISLGYDHTCALHESGEISCWGRNHYGQLGNGEENVGSHSASPQRVEGISDAIAVEAGALTTSCALHETGEVSCWGQSDLGELGTNADLSNDHSAVPVKIAGIADAIAVAAGLYHVCALHESGEVSCWGADFFGQLGNSEIVADIYSAAPVRVSGISDATAISAGFYHTCVLHQTGEITCWGSNIYGQLGSGAPLGNARSATPVMVDLD